MTGTNACAIYLHLQLNVIAKVQVKFWTQGLGLRPESIFKNLGLDFEMLLNFF